MPGGHGAFQIGAAQVLQTQHEHAACHRLAQRVRVRGEQVAHGGADQVGAVGIKALLHQQVHLPQVHHTEVDGHLLGLADPGSGVGQFVLCHLGTILMDSIWMVFEHVWGGIGGFLQNTGAR
ncbi:hypothetical protein D9M68_879700 [compost metagenome]